jgi:hypothetical protein
VVEHVIGLYDYRMNLSFVELVFICWCFYVQPRHDYALRQTLCLVTATICVYNVTLELCYQRVSSMCIILLSSCGKNIIKT